MSTLSPGSEAELSDIIAECFNGDIPVGIKGRGTKAGWGRAVTYSRHVSLAAFNGIVDYAPAELVLTAGAGTPLADIRRAVAAEGQHLAFEPMDLGPLFDQAPDNASIGGVLACNLSGSRRPLAGAARDYFLGFRGVNGRGEVFKAGGKVVKNVTGYDLPKLLAGSFGTLGLMTEITMKVVPAPETSRSIAIFGLDVAAGNAAMTSALGSTAELSGAAYFPAEEAARIGGFGSGGSAMVLRLEGATASVAYRQRVLENLLQHPVHLLAEQESTDLWLALGRLAMFIPDSGRSIWLLSVPPANAAMIIGKVRQSLPDSRYVLDWGGGRIWLSLPIDDQVDDAHASRVRAALSLGGHATLIKAPESQRRGNHLYSAEVPIALLQRVRMAFDPRRIFNRGRLHSDLKSHANQFHIGPTCRSGYCGC